MTIFREINKAKVLKINKIAYLVVFYSLLNRKRTSKVGKIFFKKLCGKPFFSQKKPSPLLPTI